MVNAGVMELADVTDSKSVGSDTVRVRLPPPAPQNSQRYMPSGVFLVAKIDYDTPFCYSNVKYLFTWCDLFHIRNIFRFNFSYDYVII